jgi:hypothetical protein
VPVGVASGVLVFLGVVQVPDPAVAVVFEIGSRHRLQISDENLWRSGADVDAVDEVDIVVASGAEAAQEGDGSLIVGGAAILVGSHVADRDVALPMDPRRSTLGGWMWKRTCVREAVKVKKAHVGGGGLI